MTTRHARQSEEHVVEVTLAADGDQTILVLEERGMPLDHLAGREHCDAAARWDEILPAYQDLAAKVG